MTMSDSTPGSQQRKVVRIDMAHAIELDGPAYIDYLRALLPLESDTTSAIGSLLSTIPSNTSSKTMTAIAVANVARKSGIDLFLDFGPTLEPFLPTSFLAKERRSAPAERHLALSNFDSDDNTTFIERCFSAILNAEPSEEAVRQYSADLMGGKLSRLAMINQFAREALAAGTQCWFKLDTDESGIRRISTCTDDLHIESSAIQEGEFRFDAKSGIFGAGWYDSEIDDGRQFRWMSDVASIRNPFPALPIIGIQLDILHVYASTTPNFYCLLGHAPVNVIVSPGSSVQFIATVATDRTQALRCEWITLKSENVGLPSEMEGVADNRRLSFAITGGVFLYEHR